MSGAKTNAQRQAALKARRKAAGLVPVTVWVYERSKGDVRAFAAATVECYQGLTTIKAHGKMRET